MKLEHGSVAMAEVGAVKILTYNFIDSALWFMMCESTFKLGVPKPVTDSKIKYNYIVAFLLPEAASVVRNINSKTQTKWIHTITSKLN